MLTSNPALGRFLADLFAEYPALTPDEDGGDGDGPWACTDDTSHRHAHLSLATASRSCEPALRRIVSLCRKHHLNCFDPQTGDSYRGVPV